MLLTRCLDYSADTILPSERIRALAGLATALDLPGHNNTFDPGNTLLLAMAVAQTSSESCENQPEQS